MTHKEVALEKFDDGFDCDKSVMMAFEPIIELDEQKKKDIFAKGSWCMETTHQSCGAVSGACQVIALCHKCKSGEMSADDLSKKFCEEFKDKNKSLFCKDLLGYDLSNMYDLKEILEKNLCETVCRKYIEDAVEILDKLAVD